MIRLTFILLLFATTSFGQNEHDQNEHEELWGEYESTNNSADKYSRIILNKDYRFIYKNRLGSCQAEISGTWTIENRKVKFANDKEVLRDDTIQLPDLGTWTIDKLGIKPDKIIKIGCVRNNRLHVKK